MSSPTDYSGRQGPYQYQPSPHNPFANAPPPSMPVTRGFDVDSDLGDQNYTPNYASPISSTTRLAPAPAFHDQNNGILLLVYPSN